MAENCLGGAKEEIPHDIPEQKGKHVTTTTYLDANLHHDQVTDKAVTACLHIVNATPPHWYTKRQATELRLQLMDLNLWQQELPQTKLICFTPKYQLLLVIAR